MSEACIWCLNKPPGGPPIYGVWEMCWPCYVTYRLRERDAALLRLRVQAKEMGE